MSIDISVQELKMSDGTTVPIPSGGITVFVGPNNSGKSVSLRDIVGHLSQPHEPPLSVKAINVSKSGTENDLHTWLEENCYKSFQNGQDHYSRNGQTSDARSLTHWWNQGPPFPALGDMITFFAGGEGRLQSANAAQNINFLTDVPTHPLHALHQNSELETKISDVCSRVFDKPLVLNRHAGTLLYLHVGEAPEATHGVGPPSHDYLEALSNLPRLEQQGDGMKSFIGLMLNILTSAYPFLFVDEPEAFLHPPQARLLGRILGEEKSGSSQIFLATHDSDFLTGLLDSPVENVTVIRLVREEDTNHTSQLDPQSIKDLWNDPLLRYSNILDGLFHEAVVLCEGDSDCRYYSSVLDSVIEEEPDFKSPDLLFTHCGGKSRVPMVVKSLRAVSVPIKVIADFDVLREETLLIQIVETLGGEWSAIEADWKSLKGTLDSISDRPSTAFVQEKITDLLREISTEKLQKSDEKNIRELIKVKSGWERIKKSGKSALPAGDATNRFVRLQEYLSSVGLFIVEVGELEGWVKQVDGHGPSWVAKVHENELHKDVFNSPPRTFIKSLVESV